MSQLSLLVAIERLSFLAKNYAAQRLSSEKRQFLEAEVTHALGLLLTLCGSLFPAEAGLYRIAIRLGEAADAAASSGGGGSPLGVLRAPKWYRGTGPGAEELGLVPPTPPNFTSSGGSPALDAAVALEATTGGALSLTRKASTAAAAHWKTLKQGVADLRERQSPIMSKPAASSSSAPSSLSASLSSAPLLSRDEIRLLHHHIEEHETFLGFVSSFVSGHSSRLVSKRRADLSTPSSITTAATTGGGVASSGKSGSAAASMSTSSFSAAPSPTKVAELPSSVSLHQFIRTARAFMGQHCAADRDAGRLVVRCLGADVVASLSSAQHAMTFWHSLSE
jgi:hypothetical protein